MRPRTPILSTALAAPLALLFSYPLFHLCARSLSHSEGLTLHNYLHHLTSPSFLRAAANSLFLASAAALAATLLSAAAGFTLAHHPFRGRRLYVLTLITLAALPAQLLLPGGYELITLLGLFDSPLAVLLPASLSVFSALLYKAAFSAVPTDLLAAARIDGCSEPRAFWHVALPAVRPTTSAVLLLSFTATYNAVVWPTVVLQSPHLETLPIRLTLLSAQSLTPDQHASLAAATTLAMLPLFLLFLLLQHDFLPPLRGSLKG